METTEKGGQSQVEQKPNESASKSEVKQLAEINVKREGVEFDNDVIEENDGKVKKKTKKMTSLQGRPAKASEEMRKFEDEIKLAAWRLAEFEENLYIKHGGSSVEFTDEHNRRIIDFVRKKTNSQLAVSMFSQMIEARKRVRETCIDPLNEPFVPLSDKYFFSIFIREGSDSISLDELLIIYAFQVYMRTNYDGFHTIFSTLSDISYLVYNCNLKQPYNIEVNLSLVEIVRLYPTLSDSMKTMYTALHTVMCESLRTFVKAPQITSQNKLKVTRGIEIQQGKEDPNPHQCDRLFNDTEKEFNYSPVNLQPNIIPLK